MVIWVCESPPDVILFSLPIVCEPRIDDIHEAEEHRGVKGALGNPSAYMASLAAASAAYDPIPDLMSPSCAERNRADSFTFRCYMKNLKHPVLEPLLDSTALGLLTLSPLRLGWWSEELEKGIAFDYGALSLHALTRRLSEKDHRPALYFQFVEDSSIYWLSSDGNMSLLMASVDKARSHSSRTSSAISSSAFHHSTGAESSRSSGSIAFLSGSEEMGNNSKRFTMDGDINLHRETELLEVYFVPDDAASIDDIFETLCRFFSFSGSSILDRSQGALENSLDRRPLHQMSNMPAALDSLQSSAVKMSPTVQIYGANDAKSLFSPRSKEYIDVPLTLPDEEDEPLSNNGFEMFRQESSSVASPSTERTNQERVVLKANFDDKDSNLTPLSSTYAGLLNDVASFYKPLNDLNELSKDKETNESSNEMMNLKDIRRRSEIFVKEELLRVLDSENDKVDSDDSSILKDIIELSSPRKNQESRSTAVEQGSVIDLTGDSEEFFSTVYGGHNNEKGSKNALPINDDSAGDQSNRRIGLEIAKTAPLITAYFDEKTHNYGLVSKNVIESPTFAQLSGPSQSEVGDHLDKKPEQRPEMEIGNEEDNDNKRSERGYYAEEDELDNDLAHEREERNEESDADSERESIVHCTPPSSEMFDGSEVESTSPALSEGDYDIQEEPFDSALPNNLDGGVLNRCRA